MYIIMARYYEEYEQFGESYILTSDNNNFNTKLEIGQKVDLIVSPEEKSDNTTKTAISLLEKLSNGWPTKYASQDDTFVRNIIAEWRKVR